MLRPEITFTRIPPPHLATAYFCGFEAGVAQLVEQLTCNQQVVGSTPIASSRFKKAPLLGPFYFLLGKKTALRNVSFSLPTPLRSILTLQHVHNADRTCTHHVNHRVPCTLNLAFACLTTQLLHRIPNLSKSGRSAWMAPRGQTTIG